MWGEKFDQPEGPDEAEQKLFWVPFSIGPS